MPLTSDRRRRTIRSKPVETTMTRKPKRQPRLGPIRLEGETDAVMMARWKREADGLEAEIKAIRRPNFATWRNDDDENAEIKRLDRLLCGYCC
jgi:hypothetical protein